jgi:hypothetical protein
VPAKSSCRLIVRTNLVARVNRVDKKRLPAATTNKTHRTIKVVNAKIKRKWGMRFEEGAGAATMRRQPVA